MNTTIERQWGTSRGRAAMLVGCATLALFATLALSAPAAACDLCAIYTGSLMQKDKTGALLGIAEQYSHIGTVRMGEDKVPNPAGEWVHSSTTQLLAGYAFTPRIGVQVNLPLISREYRRLEDGMRMRGDIGGLGDISLVGRASPLSRLVGSTLLHAELLAGLKLPTGSSSRLAGEDHGDDDHDGDHGDEAAGHAGTRPVRARSGEAHVHESAVHDHDLTLGSGSVDGLFGASLHASWRRLFSNATLQYAVRGNGDHGYEYADDLKWEVAAGVYAVAAHDWTAAVSVVTSGETKDRDHQRGEKVDDTAITAVYVGPGVALTWTSALHADLAIDVPVLQDVTGRQIVADYRLRAGMLWRF